MKFIHISDLHIGKRVNEYSMIEDQKYIFDNILKIVDNENPEGILIAGDIYDKSVPSEEAVHLFDNFLYNLSLRKKEIFIISGNHDSSERVAFASKIIESSGIHISPVYNGTLIPVSMKDEYGTVDVYMLPFIKPANVRSFFKDEDIKSYTDAIRVALSNVPQNKDNRNILITHQFVTGSKRSDSEEISVGGSDNVDASVFDAFDYVALGHIHSPQNCTSEKIRYCGSPLKYSFSEANDEKSVTVIELKEKNNLIVKTVPLKPLRDLKEIKGTYNDLMRKSFYENTTYQNDYMHITLLDEEDVPNAIAKLRVVYQNIMKLDYDNTRTKMNQSIGVDNDVDKKSPLELFSDFYYKQNNSYLNDEQKEYMEKIIEEVEKGDK